MPQPRLCQYCKMEVPRDATVCGHCGQGISPAHTIAAVIGLGFGMYLCYQAYQWHAAYSAVVGNAAK